ncbi:MAG TPA: TonB family protein [Thermoanaerobaculia bacterium]|nr:TonB family protein [Thermoanaerobaculia bacterium]
MPWILVAESEGRYAERIRDGLAADGWQVEIVPSVEAAEALASDRVPDLVVVSVELAGARALIERHARTRGGAGAVAMLPELGSDPSIAELADESVSKPFTEQDLRLLVRRLAASGHAPRKPPGAGEDEPRMTSQDLFGDVLAEMGETPAADARKPEAPRPAPAKAPTARPAAPKAAAPAATSEVDRVLEKTLSGLLGGDKKPERPKPAARKSDSAVDDLISRTLTDLGAAEKPRKAERPAPKPSPSGETPALDALLESSRAAAGEPRRAPREIDFSSLDELARPEPAASGRAPAPEAAPAAEPSGAAADRLPSKPGSEAFATQRVALPAALRGRHAQTEFGQYTLLERIAVGGMAEVWKARMRGVEGFQKTVAIKKILPHLTDSSDFVTMFIDEAKLAAQLNHTNIIHIYDLGKIGDDYYIAMEFVDGRDLRTILNTAREKSQPLPLGISLLVASKLASALDHAHRMKDFEGRPLEIVHRDVSPQNVLISFEGEVKLCDFGIVKAVSKASKTQMGALKGKLQYMSPEQAWGRPVDARSDIFSLGSLLFEMLTGRRLFAGDSEMSVLDAVREGRIQAPRDLDPRLPLEVNALVLKALAKEPGDRFETAGEMQKQLDAILSSLKPAPSQHEIAEYVHRLFGAAAHAPSAVAEAAPAATPKPAPKPTPHAPAPPAAIAPKPAEPEVGATTGTASRGGDQALETPAAGGRGLLWIGLAAVVVLAVGGYLLFGRGGAPEPAPAEPTAPTVEPSQATPPSVSEPGDTGEAAAEGEPAPPAGESAAPGPETAAAPVDVAQLVDDEVKKREESLRRQYEAELERKQKELAAAQAANEPTPAEKPAPEKAPAPTPTPAASEPKATEPTPEETQPSALASALGQTPEPAASAPPPPAEPPATRPEPRKEPARATAPATPPRLAVKEGDLVQPGPDVRAPVLVSIDRPEYPPMARRMKVEGTVVMSLLVDEKGQVLDVQLESGVTQNVGINEAALAAARSAKFRPATKDGVRVKMWYQLKVPFKL